MYTVFTGIANLFHLLGRNFLALNKLIDSCIAKASRIKIITASAYINGLATTTDVIK